MPAGRGDALGLRLALAFLAVALAAVALLAGLTAAFAAADVSDLASRQSTELTSAIAVAVAAGAAWDHNNSWASADLSPILDLAARTGADVRIRDQAGQTVTASPGFTRSTGRSPASPSWSGTRRSARSWSAPPARVWAWPTTSCGPPCCGPSPGRPGWPRCWPC